MKKILIAVIVNLIVYFLLRILIVFLAFFAFGIGASNGSVATSNLISSIPIIIQISFLIYFYFKVDKSQNLHIFFILLIELLLLSLLSAFEIIA